MNCPKCGYAMTDLDVECPRCKRLPQTAAPTPAPAPVAMPPVEPLPKAKAAPVTAVAPPRSGALTWALVGLGVAIVALLGALLWTQLRKPADGGLAERPAETTAPAVAPGAGLATGEQTAQAPAAGSGGVAQGQETAVPPATGQGNLAQTQDQPVAPATGAGGVAQGQQQNVDPATGAGGLAESEEEPWDPRLVRSWKVVYATRGSGMFTTPPIPVRRPWRVRYFTGISPEGGDEGLILPVIFSVFVGSGPLSLPIITVQQPQYSGWMPGSKRGPVTLQIVTAFNNWWIAVDQGEF